MWFTGARCEGSSKDFFIVSYVEKNTAAEEVESNIALAMFYVFFYSPPGALPTTTLPMPLYMPLKPPA